MTRGFASVVFDCDSTLARIEGIDELAGPHAAEIAALLWLGKTVRVVSGGLRPPVEAVARTLGLGSGDVAAVGIDFAADGAYAGFERASPLARSGGKAAVLGAWTLPRPVLLVGDGATDLEARPAVDAFAAYMGVAWRAPVAAGADVVIASESLAPVLALAATEDDRARLLRSEWAGLLRRGDALPAKSGGSG
jgi:phosphoserine phosphatase